VYKEKLRNGGERMRPDFEKVEIVVKLGTDH
jgi:hypothetical protein